MLLHCGSLLKLKYMYPRFQFDLVVVALDLCTLIWYTIYRLMLIYISDKFDQNSSTDKHENVKRTSLPIRITWKTSLKETGDGKCEMVLVRELRKLIAENKVWLTVFRYWCCRLVSESNCFLQKQR